MAVRERSESRKVLTNGATIVSIARSVSGIGYNINADNKYGVLGSDNIVVQSGWGIDSRAMQTRLNGLLPGEYPDVPEGGAIWVFAVK